MQHPVMSLLAVKGDIYKVCRIIGTKIKHESCDRAIHHSVTKRLVNFYDGIVLDAYLRWKRRAGPLSELLPCEQDWPA